MCLALTLFGTPEVRQHGQVVTGFRSSKAQALLYYLAVTGRPHTRPTLAGLFWGDQPEAAARTSLSKCLSNLRDLVGDAVVVERQTVAFNRHQPYYLDTEHFLAGIGQPPTSATIPTWQAALALYRGDFLEGFYVREAPDFEQWVLVQRAHYREAVLQGLHTLANWHEQGGDLTAAISHTRRLLTLEPWREEAHRQLMTRLARSGQRAAALAQFETCRRILDEELAVEPDAETMALAEAIRTGVFEKTNSLPIPIPQRPSDRPALPALPIPPTPLIGREVELDEVSALISDRHQRLITITGPGGVGKTRLALAVAAAQSQQFQHGAVFVPLSAITDPAFLPQAILQALAQPLQGKQAPQTQLLDYLHDKEHLLFLDNYEQLLPNTARLTELLAHTPRLTLLVTSRERLALQAEQLFPLAGLPHLQAHETVNLADMAAVRLFLQRVRQLQPRFVPTEDDLVAIAHICRLTEGLPLALELMASAVRSQSLPALAAALAQGELPPVATMRDRPVRHHSLAAAFEHSWQLLTVSERQVFAQLALFRGGFTQNAGQTVADASVDLLNGLRDKSLIRQQAEDRFDLHELLRQAGESKLSEAGALNAVRTRHLQYFQAVAAVLETQLIKAPESPALGAFERDAENFRVALEWGLTSPDAKPAQRWQAAWLAAQMGYFWEVRNHWSEGRLWLTQALRVAESSRPLGRVGGDTNFLRANLRYRLSRLAMDHVTAQKLLEESLTLYQQCGDQRAMVRCLQSLASLAVELGNYPLAATHIQESLVLARQFNDERMIARSLNNLADLVAEAGDFHSSMAHASEALTLARKLDDPGTLTSALNLLALAAIGLGDYHQAHNWLEEVFQRQRQPGLNVKVGPWTHRNLGLVQQLLGNYDAAITAYCKSLQLRYERQELGGMAWALEGLGETTALCEEPVRAAMLWGAADSLRRQDGSLISQIDRQRLDPLVATVRNQLGAVAFARAWSEGQKMATAQVVAYALDANATISSQP